VELLIALNNGTYESISLADWIGANSHLLLATNFEVPENTFKDFQTRNMFLVDDVLPRDGDLCAIDGPLSVWATAKMPLPISWLMPAAFPARAPA